jgi:hypothetical protein
MPPKCTKCSRPTRGHKGPIDEECTLSEAGPGTGLGAYMDLSFDSELDDKDKHGEATGGQVPPIPP